MCANKCGSKSENDRISSRSKPNWPVSWPELVRFSRKEALRTTMHNVGFVNVVASWPTFGVEHDEHRLSAHNDTHAGVPVQRLHLEMETRSFTKLFFSVNLTWQSIVAKILSLSNCGIRTLSHFTCVNFSLDDGLGLCGIFWQAKKRPLGGGNIFEKKMPIIFKTNWTKVTCDTSVKTPMVVLVVVMLTNETASSRN